MLLVPSNFTPIRMEPIIEFNAQKKEKEILKKKHLKNAKKSNIEPTIEKLSTIQWLWNYVNK